LVLSRFLQPACLFYIYIALGLGASRRRTPRGGGVLVLENAT
jgi:hypothetical protein